MTVSTAGVLEGLEKFQNQNWQIELAISLHAPNSELRKKVVPTEDKWPLDKIIKFAKNYTNKTKRYITFEYVLIHELN